MATWGEILNEYNYKLSSDNLRKKYLASLSELTGRNTIAYYSAFLHKAYDSQLSITDRDMNAFMATVHNLDKSKGLDLILHTPGGSITAAESIVTYLKKMFNSNIRVIVPQMAMSAGTMIACASKEIIMGEHSNLDPIDPQLGGVSCQAVVEEFYDALKTVQTKPNTLLIWQIIVNKYHPGFIGDCEKAIKLSTEIVKKWLLEGMFLDDRLRKSKVNTIIRYLNNHKLQKVHDRHIGIDDCEKIGLRIKRLEDNREMQDAILSVHHSFMITFAESNNTVKIVENNEGVRMIFNHID